MSQFYGWKLLAAFWVILFINLAFPAYGSSVINAYMVSDLSLDRRTLGLMVSVYMMMSGLPGPLVAMYVNRYGVRATLMTGSTILMSGALGMATLVNSGIGAVIFFGVIVGLGVMSGGALAAQTGTAFWFIRRRALAISLILSAGGIGGFIATRALNGLISYYDGNWRAGWWLIASMALISVIVAAVFVKEKPQDIGQLPDGGALVCMMTVMSNYFGSKAYASVIGITLAVQTTIGASASLIAGDLYERHGSDTFAFVDTALLCFAGTLLLIVIRPPKRPKPEAAGDVADDALPVTAGN